MTGHAERELALRAISLGAWDFLPKPIDPDILKVVVERALTKRRLERELAQWRARALPDENTMGMIGISTELAELRSLDEIGEMPLSMQVKLLRFLQSGSFFAIGARTEQRVDVRIVAATNRDLALMMQENTFRDDLYYRLKGIQLRTTALAERTEDIALIAQSIASKSAHPRRLGAPALEWIMSHPWPGNVR
jgi:DNA-binding NtrC family response regulator